MTVSVASDRQGSSAGTPPHDSLRAELELIARLGMLRDDVCALVGDQDAALVDIDGRWPSADGVAVLARECVDRLRQVKSSDEDTAKRLIELIVAVQRLALDWYVHDITLRGNRLADCAAALARLRGVASSNALMESAAREVVLRCGFRRAALSKVEGRGWKPLMIQDKSGPGMTSWFTRWGSRPVPFRETPEAWMLSTRQALLVHDTADAPVYRPFIVAAGQSQSYVSAPLVCGDAVFGLLHSDHHPLPRRADEGDREVLWAFADGFSAIYERAVLQERFRTYRDDVRDLVTGFADNIDKICESTQPSARSSAAGGEGRSPSPRGDLTRRESEVLDLIVLGASNREIAEQLVIASDTVKTHVQKILRKCGAANRTQVIAAMLRDD